MTAARLAPPVSPRRSPPSTRQIVLVLPLLGLMFGLLAVRKTQPRLGWAGAVLILTVLVGCGASYNTTRTPAGSYPITVTATSGGSSKTSTVILTVN
jgi:apolipoprotein N-acyltransferase